jgi:SAM-dependent methyltransferase
MGNVSDGLAAHYDSYYSGKEAEWRRIGAAEKCGRISRLGSSIPHEKILDIGAGDGSNLARLAELGFGDSYAAVELSSTAIDILRGRNIPGLVSAEVFDGSTLPFEDDSFDLVYLSHVVEHLEHPRQLLSEARRVGRALIVEVPLEHNARLPRDYVPDAVGHINHYTPHTLRYLLQTSHFDIVDQELAGPGLEALEYMYGKPKGPFVYAVKQMLLRTSSSLATRLFTYNLCVLAEPTDRFRLDSPTTA